MNKRFLNRLYKLTAKAERARRNITLKKNGREHGGLPDPVWFQSLKSELESLYLELKSDLEWAEQYE